MWNIDPKRMFDAYGFDYPMISSPFAFPRLPPSGANHNMGISKTGQLKEEIIRNNASMLSRLFDFHTSFQQHASGLFDLAPSNQFRPGHPMHSKTNVFDSLKIENEQLKKENAILKQNLEKNKKQ
ncbi:MAG TPA: hypothetical protein VLD38_08410 [Nitrosopumilaceae archaeon]|nr:hypothetical protein [Nitrosopumilaceae archaeon]